MNPSETFKNFKELHSMLCDSANFSNRPAPTLAQVYDSMHSKFATCYAHSKWYNVALKGDICSLNTLTGERGYSPEPDVWFEWNGTEYVPIYRA